MEDIDSSVSGGVLEIPKISPTDCLLFPYLYCFLISSFGLFADD